jgi:hypothetical protein
MSAPVPVPPAVQCYETIMIGPTQSVAISDRSSIGFDSGLGWGVCTQAAWQSPPCGVLMVKHGDAGFQAILPADALRELARQLEALADRVEFAPGGVLQ